MDLKTMDQTGGYKDTDLKTTDQTGGYKDTDLKTTDQTGKQWIKPVDIKTRI